MAKEYDDDLEIVFDKETGQHVYSGIAWDIVSLISQHLNFTCNVYPHANQTNNISWYKFDDELNSGRADLGIAIMSQDNELRFNVTITYPISGGFMHGVRYVKTSQKKTNPLQKLMSVENLDMFLLFLAGIFLSIVRLS